MVIETSQLCYIRRSGRAALRALLFSFFPFCSVSLFLLFLVKVLIRTTEHTQQKPNEIKKLKTLLKGADSYHRDLGRDHES